MAKNTGKTLFSEILCVCGHSSFINLNFWLKALTKLNCQFRFHLNMKFYFRSQERNSFDAPISSNNTCWKFLTIFMRPHESGRILLSSRRSVRRSVRPSVRPSTIGVRRLSRKVLDGFQRNFTQVFLEWMPRPQSIFGPVRQPGCPLVAVLD